MKLIFLLSISILMLYSCTKPAVPKRKTPATSQQLSQVAKETHSISNNHAASKVQQKKSKTALAPTKIFDRYSSAVFKIHTSNGFQGSQGSGFFISDNGIAISNYHVFQGTIMGYEEIILSNGNKYKISNVYYKDENNDLIIFKVELPGKINYIKIADEIPEVGEKVYTIGSPRGLDNTFSSGEISQIRNNGKILQISAPIDHGSSGGVLLNLYGEAIGITSAGYDDSGANLNFAININIIKPYIKHFID